MLAVRFTLHASCLGGGISAALRALLELCFYCVFVTGLCLEFEYNVLVDENIREQYAGYLLRYICA